MRLLLVETPNKINNPIIDKVNIVKNIVKKFKCDIAEKILSNISNISILI